MLRNIFTCLSLLSAVGTTNCYGQAIGSGNFFILKQHRNRSVSSIAVSDDNRYVAYSRTDNLAFLWRLNPLELMRTYDLKQYTSSDQMGISSLFFSMKSDLLRLLNTNGTISSISISTGMLKEHRQPAIKSSPTFSQLYNNGKQAAVITSPSEASIINTSDGKIISSGLLLGTRIKAASISANGNLLATQDDDQNVLLYDMKTQRIIASTRGIMENSEASEFSKDENRFICQSSDGRILLWTKSENAGFKKIDWYCPLSHIALSPDSRLIAISAMHSSRSILLSSTSILRIEPNGSVTRSLYTMSADPNIIRLRGHFMSCMVFSPDSESILLGSEDGSVLIWKFKEGKQTVIGDKDLSSQKLQRN